MKNNNKKTHRTRSYRVLCFFLLYFVQLYDTKNGTAFLASLVKILLKIHNVSFFVWCVYRANQNEIGKTKKTYKNLYKQTLCRLARGLRNNLWSNIYTKKWLIFFSSSRTNLLTFCSFSLAVLSRKATSLAVRRLWRPNPRSIHLTSSTGPRMACCVFEVPGVSTIPR